MYSKHLVRQGGSFSGEEVDCDQNKHGCWNYSEEFQADMKKCLCSPGWCTFFYVV